MSSEQAKYIDQLEYELNLVNDLLKKHQDGVKEFDRSLNRWNIRDTMLTTKLAAATEVIRFYGEYDNFSKHPDEEYIVETMGLTLKDAQLGYKARKWLGENVEK